MSFSKEAIKAFFTHSHIGTTSLFERWGDRCLYSVRTFSEGRQYLVLTKHDSSDKNKQIERYAFENDHIPFQWRSLDCIKAIAALILVPLGVVLKAASFITSSGTRQDYRAWSQPQLLPKFSDLLSKILPCAYQYVTEPKERERSDLYRLTPWNLGEKQSQLLKESFNKSILEHIKVFKNDNITYMSYGCSGLLNDWLLIAKMAQQGVKEIHVDLVDERKPTGEEWRGLVYLQQQLAKEGIVLSFDWYKTVAECHAKHSNRSYHFVVNSEAVSEIVKVDEKGRRELIKARDYLVDQGRVFDYRNSSTDVMNKQGLVIGRRSALDKMVSEMDRTRNAYAQHKDELLVYGIHCAEKSLEEDLYLIHHLIQQGYKKIEIHLSTKVKGSSGDPKSQIQMMQEHFHSLKVPGVEVTVKAFDELPAANTYYDIINIYVNEKEQAVVATYKDRLKKDGDLFLHSLYMGYYHLNNSMTHPLIQFEKSFGMQRTSAKSVFGIDAFDCAPQRDNRGLGGFFGGGGLFGF